MLTLLSLELGLVEPLPVWEGKEISLLCIGAPVGQACAASSLIKSHIWRDSQGTELLGFQNSKVSKERCKGMLNFLFLE